jgi:hypothetical protein
MATVLIHTTVDVEQEVDVDLPEFVDDLEDDEARELHRLVSERLNNGFFVGCLLEEAYLAMRGRPDLPQALRDYFWQVLGRAC